MTRMEQRSGMRAFGVAGAMDRNSIQGLAKAAEDFGYSTFWVNDTPNGDGLKALASAAEVTSAIRLGVGVIPVDRKDATAIAGAIDRFELPVDRLIVGIGSGATLKGSLDLVSANLEQLGKQCQCQRAVGALGPKMIELAARSADAVLLNWLTPPAAVEARNWMKEAAPDRHAEMIGYVRVAMPDGESRLVAEAERYGAIPQYARHFERMGSEALATAICGDAASISSGLAAFEAVLDEVVVRAIARTEALVDYQNILQAAAPK